MSNDQTLLLPSLLAFALAVAGCSSSGSPDAKALCHHALNHLADCGKITIKPETIEQKCADISISDKGETAKTDLWCVPERADAEECIKGDKNIRKCYMQLDRSSDFYQNTCCAICPEELGSYYACLKTIPVKTASATAAKEPL